MFCFFEKNSNCKILFFYIKYDFNIGYLLVFFYFTRFWLNRTNYVFFYRLIREGAIYASRFQSPIITYRTRLSPVDRFISRLFYRLIYINIPICDLILFRYSYLQLIDLFYTEFPFFCSMIYEYDFISIYFINFAYQYLRLIDFEK